MYKSYNKKKEKINNQEHTHNNTHRQTPTHLQLSKVDLGTDKVYLFCINIYK